MHRVMAHYAQTGSFGNRSRETKAGGFDRHRTLAAFSVVTLVLSASTARAEDLEVDDSGDEVWVTSPGVFTLRFVQSRGGGITEYYDLAHDPGATTNLVARSGSLYDGIFIAMFKQESPEAWTASFLGSAAVLQVLEVQPDYVEVRVQGDFVPGAGGFSPPVSYEILYTITSSSGIYVHSRLIFNEDYSNEMQIRLGMALSSTFATATGWVEFSQDQDLTPYYYHGGFDDDYIGARLDAATAEIDPVLVMYEDWDICDYVLLIAPPNAENECLIAWVSNRHHSFAAGETIEHRFLLVMNQSDIDSCSDPGALAASYRAGSGDYSGSLQAVILAEPDSGDAPLTVSFDASTSVDPDGSIESCSWDFGDGHTASDFQLSHVFETPGDYQVTLTVVDDDDNTAQSETTIHVYSPHDVIIDNSDGEPFFVSHGDWPIFSIRPGYYGANYALNEAGTGNDWARWTPNITAAGPYGVYASWTTDVDRPTDVPFTVHHAEGATEVFADMRTSDASGWNLLGEFELLSGSSCFVELTDQTSTGAEVVADAIRFEFHGEVTPECLDSDSDGFSSEACGGDDCDDNDSTVNPGVTEICGDGRDNNCDGLTDDLDESTCGSSSSDAGPLPDAQNPDSTPDPYPATSFTGGCGCRQVTSSGLSKGILGLFL